MTDSSFTPSRRAVLGGAAALAAAAAGAGGAAAEAAGTSLTGKSVLITGCSSGFGRLSALHLARQGATVIATMRNMEGGARAEAAELADIAAQESLPLHLVEIDVLDAAQVESGVAEAEEIAGGGLDVVVANAGIAFAGPTEIADEEARRLIFDTNLDGAHRVARAALPKMRARGQGLIVPISSQLGRLVLPGLGLYCGTKFAMEALFEAMAYELAPSGVEVTIIQPGGYPTRIWDNGVRYTEDLLARLDEERAAAYETHIAMARGFFASEQTTDPMDIPRAIADLMRAEAGKRPLRRAVHPDTRLSSAANTAMADIQAVMLSNGAFAAWHANVTD